MAIATINPATGETVKVFRALSQGEIDAKLTLAREAFPAWSRRPVAERAAIVRTTPSPRRASTATSPTIRSARCSR
jgi:acyl-CoA reductase-like NAD-dependent aldehyde dehydrogenase